MIRRTLLVCLPLWLGLGAGAGDVITNEKVIQLVEAKLSEDLVLSVINGSECAFKTDVDAILQLKQKGVTDRIIEAMVKKTSGSSQPRKLEVSPTPSPVGAVDTAAAGVEILPSEAGVYWLRDNRLEEMEPEIVNWRTGGFLKTVATAGLTKGHVSGVVRGARAKRTLKGDEVLYICTLEGTSASEYQLLRMEQKSDRREFRAMTGGVIHASSGADRNAVPFEPKKIASRVYKFTLPGVGPGEYGLLPPGVSSASVASAGKIYSFTVGY
jgi:hypothetical protein